MKQLNAKEQRTVKLGLGVLIVFFGFHYGNVTWTYLEGRRDAFSTISTEREALASKIELEKEKIAQVDSLRAELGVDLSKLDSDTVVPESLTAIRQTAGKHSIALGKHREVQDSTKSNHLARFYFEAKGETQSMTQFIHDLGRLPWPFVIDRLDLDAGKQPGHVRLSIEIRILNYADWKGGASRA
ncbi:MAG: hypothetical protein AAF517_13695 [Planctomycetota bacterium]